MSPSEKLALLEKAHVFEHLSLFLWDIFYPSKMKAFYNSLSSGKAPLFAFKDAQLA